MRNRFLKHGLDNFDDHNVLELLLFYAQPRKDTNALAHQLIETFGGLDKVLEASPDALMGVQGVGETMAALIHLVPEIYRRYELIKQRPQIYLPDSHSVGNYLMPYFVNSTVEKVYLLCLGSMRDVLDCVCVGVGDRKSAPVNIQVIVKTALEKSAAAVVVGHNHVDGIALPSQEDLLVTQRLKAAMELVGVSLADHIIVGGDDFVSLADSGGML
jgi:DNA repair protein RadC